MKPLVIAGLLTFLVFIIITVFKSIHRFRIFLEVKKNVLLYTALYLLDKSQDTFISHEYKDYIWNILKMKKLSKWVEVVEVLWKSQLVLQVKFKVVYTDHLKHEFTFPMNLHELRNKKGAVDHESKD